MASNFLDMMSGTPSPAPLPRFPASADVRHRFPASRHGFLLEEPLKA